MKKKGDLKTARGLRPPENCTATSRGTILFRVGKGGQRKALVLERHESTDRTFWKPLLPVFNRNQGISKEGNPRKWNKG